MEEMTIPLDVVLDLPSVDATYGFHNEDGPWGKVRDILGNKDRENIEYKEWDHTWQQMFPIHLFIGGRDQYACNQYGLSVPYEYEGQLLMGNGHHRVAHLHRLGRKYAKFTFDIKKSDW